MPIGQMHIINAIIIENSFPVLGKLRKSQLLTPNWIILAKNAEKGTQEYPADAVANNPKIHQTINADNKVKLYEMYVRTIKIAANTQIYVIRCSVRKKLPLKIC